MPYNIIYEKGMRVLNKSLPVLLICVSIVLFFSNLFIPRIQLFSTPDFGQSDIWNLNLPNKYFLFDSLHHQHWPLWNPYIGNGFPALAEGQIGTFNMFNLLLFRFLPFPLAFNIGYILIFLTAAFGTYTFTRSLRMSNTASLFSAFIFAFSGPLITQVNHLNLIQAASYMPWLFFLSLKIARSKSWKYAPLFAIVLSQQIFSGHPQAVLISLVGTTLYFLFSLKSTPIKAKGCSIFIFSILLGFGISAMQLLPQKEFLDLSTRAGGLSSETTTLFSFPFQHLKTMINPYILGNPAKGTYPDFISFDGSVFWENTGYIGVLPLVLCLVALFKTKRKDRYFFVILILVSFFLMLGKYSPFYFVFPIPPFSFFRVPSRFILLFTWSLVILAGLGLDHIRRRSSLNKVEQRYPFVVLKASVAVIAIAHLVSFSYFYNPVFPAQYLLALPEKTNPPFSQKETKLLSLGASSLWNRINTSQGWRNLEEYRKLLNAYLGNYSTIPHLHSLNMDQAQMSRRYAAIWGPLTDFSINSSQTNASASAVAKNLLEIYRVSDIITPYNLHGLANFVKNDEIKITQTGETLKFYRNNRPGNQIYLTDNVFFSTTLNDFYSHLPEMSSGEVVTEEDVPLMQNNTPLNYSIEEITTADIRTKILLNSNKKAVLVINSSYYPGWKAVVNNTQQWIVPVNINQQGVVVEKGQSTITLEFDPDSFRIGKIITFLSLFLALAITLLQTLKRH